MLAPGGLSGTLQRCPRGHGVVPRLQRLKFLAGACARDFKWRGRLAKGARTRPVKPVLAPPKKNEQGRTGTARRHRRDPKDHWQDTHGRVTRIYLSTLRRNTRRGRSPASTALSAAARASDRLFRWMCSWPHAAVLSSPRVTRNATCTLGST